MNTFSISYYRHLTKLHGWKKVQILGWALLIAVHSQSGREKVSPTPAFWWSNASSDAENVFQHCQRI